MNKLNLEISDIAFIIFVLIFPLGIIGSICNMFGYPLLSYLSMARGVGYVLGAIFFVFYLPKLSSHVFHISGHSTANLLIYIVSPLLILLIFIAQLLTHFDVIGPVAVGVKKSAFEFNWPILVSSISMFFIGFYVNDFIVRKVRLIFFFWCVSVLFILFNVDYSKLTLNFMGTTDPSNRAFTLVLSDSFAILTLCVFPILNSKVKVLFALFLSLLCLFFISSRTAFLVMLITYTIFTIRDITNVKTIFIFLLGVMIFYFFWEYLQDNTSGYAARLFTIDNDDSSLSGRVTMLESGLNAIKNNFFLGDFAGQLQISSDAQGARWGGYIHGVFSYFRQFGILGFIGVIVLVLNSILVLIKVQGDNHLARLTSMLPVYILIISIASRGYVYPWLFLIPGLIFSLQYKSNSNK
jgi:hypothetical protein